MDKHAFAEHLLKNPTWPERILWSRLRQKQLGYSFQRQALLFGYIVDFWCPRTRVVIELDGSVHARPENAARDVQKDAIFAKSGIDCLRFENSDVKFGMTAVLIRIWEHCYARVPVPIRPFYIEIHSSSLENSEISALRSVMEHKRLEMHEKSFSQRYWKNRVLPVNRSRT